MYVTVYCVSRQNRKTGRVKSEGRVYRTKSLTPHHAFLRAKFPGAETWRDPERVITDFVPGMNLGIRPIPIGGTLIAEAGA